MLRDSFIRNAMLQDLNYLGTNNSLKFMLISSSNPIAPDKTARGITYCKCSSPQSKAVQKPPYFVDIDALGSDFSSRECSSSVSSLRASLDLEGGALSTPFSFSAFRELTLLLFVAPRK